MAPVTQFYPWLLSGGHSGFRFRVRKQPLGHMPVPRAHHYCSGDHSGDSAHRTVASGECPHLKDSCPLPTSLSLTALGLLPCQDPRPHLTTLAFSPTYPRSPFGEEESLGRQTPRLMSSSCFLQMWKASQTSGPTPALW